MAEARAGSGFGENEFCSWTFEKGSNGRILPKSLRITNKSGEQCTALESDKLYIGGAPNDAKEVLDSGNRPMEFVTKGSCRRCYLNTFGGMTCIVYPGC